MSKFEAVLALDPTHETAEFNLGVVHARQQHLVKAIHCFRRLLQRNPSHAQAHVELGRVYETRGETGRALREYSAAVHANPDHGWAHQKTGTLFRGRALTEASDASEHPLWSHSHSPLHAACTAQRLLLDEFDGIRAMHQKQNLSDDGRCAVEWLDGLCAAGTTRIVDLWKVIRQSPAPPPPLVVAQEAGSRVPRSSQWLPPWCVLRDHQQLFQTSRQLLLVGNTTQSAPYQTGTEAPQGNSSPSNQTDHPTSHVTPEGAPEEDVLDTQEASRVESSGNDTTVSEPDCGFDARVANAVVTLIVDPEREMSDVDTGTSTKQVPGLLDAATGMAPTLYRVQWCGARVDSISCFSIATAAAQRDMDDVLMLIEVPGGIVSGLEPVHHTACTVLRTASGCWLPFEEDRHPFPLTGTTNVRAPVLASTMDYAASQYTNWVAEGLVRLVYVDTYPGCCHVAVTSPHLNALCSTLLPLLRSIPGTYLLVPGRSQSRRFVEETLQYVFHEDMNRLDAIRRYEEQGACLCACACVQVCRVQGALIMLTCLY